MTPRAHRLPNGLHVVVDPMPGVRSVAVGLHAFVGARSEPLAGLAHMAEHMVFKGAGGRGARAIAEAMEDVGGQLNAWTGRDATAFHARVLEPDLALGLDLIADLVRAPHLDPDELERERGVILAELAEARDAPEDAVWDDLFAAAYPGQPLGRPVLGTPDSVGAVSAADLSAWFADQFRPDALAVVASGAVDEDALLRVVEARWGDLAPGTPPAPPTAAYSGGTAIDPRRLDGVQLATAWPGLPAGDPDGRALQLWSQAAGEGMSSRLFQTVREEAGLAYSVYSWMQGFADTGLFGFALAAAPRDAARAERMAHQALAAAAEDMTQRELDRAKAATRAGLLMSLESPAARAEAHARTLQVHGRLQSTDELLDEIAAPTLQEVRTVAAKILAGPRATATVGRTLARAA